MTTTYTKRLDTEDWLVIGYFLGIGLVWLINYLSKVSEPDNGGPNSGQRIRLDERALERLEDGDSMKIPRWHGGDLVLTGDVVVPVPSETEDDKE